MVDLRRLDGDPHLVAFTQAELGEGSRRDLSHDGHRTLQMDASMVLVDVQGVDRRLPGVAWGAVRSTGIQRDGARVDRDEHVLGWVGGITDRELPAAVERERVSFRTAAIVVETDQASGPG